MASPAGQSFTATGAPAHRAFFEALGTLPGGSSEWRAALAGLVTLRYLDAWTDSGVTAADLATERKAVEDAISVLPPHVPERIFLAGLIDVSTPDRERDLTRIISLLLAYGRALQRRCSWALAADVFVRAYRACTHVTEQPVQRELAASAVLRAGQCYWELGDAPAAQHTYELALSLGHDARDEYAVFRARTALARLAADQGVEKRGEGFTPVRVEGEPTTQPADRSAPIDAGGPRIGSSGDVGRGTERDARPRAE